MNQHRLLFELDRASPAYRRTGYLPHPVGPKGRPIAPLGGYALTIPANIAAERIEPVWIAPPFFCQSGYPSL